MKDVPIKFRGKDIITGDYLYGDLLHARGEVLILENRKDGARTVDKNSVAQLVGYDAKGNEVYEGDTLDVIDDSENVATLIGAAFIKGDPQSDTFPMPLNVYLNSIRPVLIRAMKKKKSRVTKK